MGKKGTKRKTKWLPLTGTVGDGGGTTIVSDSIIGTVKTMTGILQADSNAVLATTVSIRSTFEYTKDDQYDSSVTDQTKIGQPSSKSYNQPTRPYNSTTYSNRSNYYNGHRDSSSKTATISSSYKLSSSNRNYHHHQKPSSTLSGSMSFKRRYTRPSSTSNYMGRTNRWSSSDPGRRQSTTVTSYRSGDVGTTMECDSNKENVSSETVKPLFNEDDYTRITTPRQDVLFKKGYLSRPKKTTVPSNCDAGASSSSGAVSVISTEESTTSTSVPSISPEHYTTFPDMYDTEQPFMYPGFYDTNGVFYVNPYLSNGLDPYGGPIVVMPVDCINPYGVNPVEIIDDADEMVKETEEIVEEKEMNVIEDKTSELVEEEHGNVEDEPNNKDPTDSRTDSPVNEPTDGTVDNCEKEYDSPINEDDTNNAEQQSGENQMNPTAGILPFYQYYYPFMFGMPPPFVPISELGFNEDFGYESQLDHDKCSRYKKRKRRIRTPGTSTGVSSATTDYSEEDLSDTEHFDEQNQNIQTDNTNDDVDDQFNNVIQNTTLNINVSEFIPSNVQKSNLNVNVPEFHPQIHHVPSQSDSIDRNATINSTDNLYEIVELTNPTTATNNNNDTIIMSPNKIHINSKALKNQLLDNCMPNDKHISNKSISCEVNKTVIDGAPSDIKSSDKKTNNINNNNNNNNKILTNSKIIDYSNNNAKEIIKSDLVHKRNNNNKIKNCVSHNKLSLAEFNNHVKNKNVNSKIVNKNIVKISSKIKEESFLISPAKKSIETNDLKSINVQPTYAQMVNPLPPKSELIKPNKEIDQKGDKSIKSIDNEPKKLDVNEPINAQNTLPIIQPTKWVTVKSKNKKRSQKQFEEIDDFEEWVDSTVDDVVKVDKDPIKLEIIEPIVSEQSKTDSITVIEPKPVPVKVKKSKQKKSAKKTKSSQSDPCTESIELKFHSSTTKQSKSKLIKTDDRNIEDTILTELLTKFDSESKINELNSGTSSTPTYNSIHFDPSPTNIFANSLPNRIYTSGLEAGSNHSTHNTGFSLNFMNNKFDYVKINNKNSSLLREEEEMVIRVLKSLTEREKRSKEKETSPAPITTETVNKEVDESNLKEIDKQLETVSVVDEINSDDVEENEEVIENHQNVIDEKETTIINDGDESIDDSLLDNKIDDISDNISDLSSDDNDTTTIILGKSQSMDSLDPDIEPIPSNLINNSDPSLSTNKTMFNQSITDKMDDDYMFEMTKENFRTESPRHSEDSGILELHGSEDLSSSQSVTPTTPTSPTIIDFPITAAVSQWLVKKQREQDPIKQEQILRLPTDPSLFSRIGHSLKNHLAMNTIVLNPYYSDDDFDTDDESTSSTNKIDDCDLNNKSMIVRSNPLSTVVKSVSIPDTDSDYLSDSPIKNEKSSSSSNSVDPIDEPDILEYWENEPMIQKSLNDDTGTTSVQLLSMVDDDELLSNNTIFNFESETPTNDHQSLTTDSHNDKIKSNPNYKPPEFGCILM